MSDGRSFDFLETRGMRKKEGKSHKDNWAHLNLKRKVSLEILDDEDEERESDSEAVVGTVRSCNVSRAHIVANDFQSHGTNVRVSNSLDVTILSLNGKSHALMETSGINNSEGSMGKGKVMSQLLTLLHQMLRGLQPME
jgi:hypothetical protein